MGEVIDIMAELAKENPRTSKIKLQIYAGALRTYHEAALNIHKHGAICAHPRTGAPIENPYLKIRAQQAAILGKMSAVKSDRVQGLLQDMSTAELDAVQQSAPAAGARSDIFRWRK